MIDISDKAHEWWRSIKKVNVNEIGGLYFKTRFLCGKELIDQIYQPLSYKEQRTVQESFNFIKAKVGKNASDQAFIDAVSSRSPLILVDRHTNPLLKILSLLTLKQYRRYAWVNPMQVSLVGLMQNLEQNGNEELIICSFIASYKSIDGDYIKSMEKKFHDYVVQGVVDDAI